MPEETARLVLPGHLGQTNANHVAGGRSLCRQTAHLLRRWGANRFWLPAKKHFCQWPRGQKSECPRHRIISQLQYNASPGERISIIEQTAPGMLPTVAGRIKPDPPLLGPGIYGIAKKERERTCPRTPFHDVELGARLFRKRCQQSAGLFPERRY